MYVAAYCTRCPLRCAPWVTCSRWRACTTVRTHSAALCCAVRRRAHLCEAAGGWRECACGGARMSPSLQQRHVAERAFGCAAPGRRHALARRSSSRLCSSGRGATQARRRPAALDSGARWPGPAGMGGCANCAACRRVRRRSMWHWNASTCRSRAVCRSEWSTQPRLKRRRGTQRMGTTLRWTDSDQQCVM